MANSSSPIQSSSSDMKYDHEEGEPKQQKFTEVTVVNWMGELISMEQPKKWDDAIKVDQSHPRAMLSTPRTKQTESLLSIIRKIGSGIKNADDRRTVEDYDEGWLEEDQYVYDCPTRFNLAKFSSKTYHAVVKRDNLKQLMVMPSMAVSYTHLTLPTKA